MGNGMDKILPGLYVGNLKDSMDEEQIKKNNITHILSIHDTAADGDIKNVKYMCICASDNANQDLMQYFSKCIEFIHEARLAGGCVLVHCLAGISRSTTIVIAYIMTVTDLSWVDSINAVRGARKVANPNFGFQRQLQNYEFTQLKTEKEKLIKAYGVLNIEDTQYCRNILVEYHEHQRQLLAKNKGVPEQKIYPLPFNAYNLDGSKNNSNKIVLENKNCSTTIDNKSSDMSKLTNNIGQLEVANKLTTNLTNIPCIETVDNQDLNRFFN